MFKRPICSVVLITFVFTLIGPYKPVHADVLGLPAPGSMVNLSPAYQPALIKGITIHKDNPFLFDFIIDTGNDATLSSLNGNQIMSSLNGNQIMSSLNGNQIMSSPNASIGDLQQERLKQVADRLVKYFFASLAIPEKDLWVNLSPYEKNRMVPSALGQTALGRDLLAQDYILKQLTASLIYPESHLGREFWDRVYARAQAEYGTTQIPVNTFNKVWILADKATVYEHCQTAFVVSGHLKVMLEEDYLALQKHATSSKDSVILSPRLKHSGVNSAKDLNKINSVRDSSATPQNDNHSIASNIIRQIILPELEKEVNSGKNFAMLRQIFYSQILATWYKKNLKEALLNQVYTNKSMINGIQRNVIPANAGIQDMSPQGIYEQYLKAYKKGVFNYIKEDNQSIPRKYFSGGYTSVGLGKNLKDIQFLTAIQQRAVIKPLGSFAMISVLDEFQSYPNIERKGFPKKFHVDHLIEGVINFKSAQLRAQNNAENDFQRALYELLKSKRKSPVKVLQASENLYSHLTHINKNMHIIHIASGILEKRKGTLYSQEILRLIEMQLKHLSEIEDLIRISGKYNQKTIIRGFILNIQLFIINQSSAIRGNKKVSEDLLAKIINLGVQLAVTDEKPGVIRTPLIRKIVTRTLDVLQVSNQKDSILDKIIQAAQARLAKSHAMIATSHREQVETIDLGNAKTEFWQIVKKMLDEGLIPPEVKIEEIANREQIAGAIYGARNTQELINTARGFQSALKALQTSTKIEIAAKKEQRGQVIAELDNLLSKVNTNSAMLTFYERRKPVGAFARRATAAVATSDRRVSMKVALLLAGKIWDGRNTFGEMYKSLIVGPLVDLSKQNLKLTQRIGVMLREEVVELSQNGPKPTRVQKEWGYAVTPIEFARRLEILGKVALPKAKALVVSMLDSNSAVEFERQIKSAAMNAAEKRLKTQHKSDSAMNHLGGIDLNSANMAMTVTKDANGGVQVSFNPALIAQIRKQGVYSAVPVIVNVQSISASQLEPLLNLSP